MTMRRVSRFVVLASLWLGLGQPGVVAEVRPPNFVFILMDDLGWADIGANGSSFYQTPRIDGLAREGARFTSAYAACPVCSPTRASILTGKYPARLHLTDWLPGRGDGADQKLAAPAIEQQLPLGEVTIAEALQSAGYISAHVGKWHLGGEGYGPLEQGFAVNVAGDHTGTPLSYFAPYQRNGRFMPGLEEAPEGEYLTDRLTAEAEHFIEENRDRPFFLYFAHYAVHIPLKAKEDLIQKHLARVPTGGQTNAVYAAMVESMDQSVGRILDKLDELKIAEDTVVVFFSDNGGLATLEGPFTPATSNAPLRNGKGYLQEGGIREPLLVRWPGRIEAGRVIDTPVSSIDFFPTLLEMAGVESGGEVDGINLLPLLTDGLEPARDALFWYYPHYANQARSTRAPLGGGPGAAVRVGSWKLIQHFESGDHELYDLSRDIGEVNNLAGDFPGKVQELSRLIYDWQNSVKAQWPMQNSGYANPPVTQGNDGKVVMHARDGFVHGKNLRYEPQPFKNTIGYWTLAEDWVHWDFEVSRGGRFRLQILQGCGSGCGGSEVAFTVAGQERVHRVEETGHFQNFFWRDLGEVEVGVGRGQLTVKPLSKPGPAVMDLREVRLVPVK
jgi:arylsulfatase A